VIRIEVRTDSWGRLPKIAIQQGALADRSKVIARIARPGNDKRCLRIHTAQGIRCALGEAKLLWGVPADLAVGFKVRLTDVETPSDPDFVVQIPDPTCDTL
jgi:hypothetical protein